MECQKGLANTVGHQRDGTAGIRLYDQITASCPAAQVDSDAQHQHVAAFACPDVTNAARAHGALSTEMRIRPKASPGLFILELRFGVRCVYLHGGQGTQVADHGFAAHVKVALAD